ncbi:hypothetical protein ATO4_22052 [Aurantimonas sp. 22II-16-19i]|nr:hypothetical protein ATO4_22052 [Aurantimonas sp. 22II-16-19i]
MNVQDQICEAIRERFLLRFWYPRSQPDDRVVEPHLLGFNSAAGTLTLSAWQISGGSGVGFRPYHVNLIKNFVVTDERFSGTRIGYNPNDTTMSRIICRI